MLLTNSLKSTMLTFAGALPRTSEEICIFGFIGFKHQEQAWKGCCSTKGRTVTTSWQEEAFVTRTTHSHLTNILISIKASVDHLSSQISNPSDCGGEDQESPFLTFLNPRAIFMNNKHCKKKSNHSVPGTGTGLIW